MFSFQKLRKFSCPACGIIFAVPKTFVYYKWETSGSVYCPNGHIMHFRECAGMQVKDSPKK